MHFPSLFLQDDPGLRVRQNAVRLLKEMLLVDAADPEGGTVGSPVNDRITRSSLRLLQAANKCVLHCAHPQCFFVRRR